MNRGASPHDSNTREQHKAHKNLSSLSSSGVQGQRSGAMGYLVPRFWDGGVSETHNKIDPSQIRGKGTPLYHLKPRDNQTGKTLKPQRHRRERPQREPNKGMWTHQRMSGFGCKRGQSGG
jgi:hypothetical protein